MRVEKIQNIWSAVWMVVKHLNAGPCDHYAEVFLGSKSADKAGEEDRLKNFSIAPRKKLAYQSKSPKPNLHIVNSGPTDPAA